MRPVNLLPERYRPRTGAGADSRTPYFVLAALALVAFAVFGYVMTANKVSSRNSEIAEARQQIAAAEAEAVTLKGYGDFAGVKEARLSAVKSLATARIDWERLFRELAHVMPPRVWLTGFNAQSAPADGGAELAPTLALDGCAENHSRVADAMVRLRELHLAEEVQLTQTVAGKAEGEAGSSSSSSSSDGDCGRFYQFSVSVTMSPPSAAAIEAAPSEVPARLGGGG